MEKKSFVFYVSWNEAIKKMDEQQIRRFIDNLCNYAEGKDVNLDGLIDEIMWSQVKPLLDHNETKRQKRIENGRKGGAPSGNNNAQKKTETEETTKNNLNQAKQTETSKTSVEGRGMMDEGRRLKDEGRRLKVDVEGRRLKEDVEGRGKNVEGRSLKDEVEEQLTDEMKKVVDRYNRVGWNNLTPTECNLMYEIKKITDKE